MKLQIALDRIELEEAAGLVDQIRNHTDIIEVGTSLIKDYGLVSVRMLKQIAGNTSILADLKTMDEGEYEFRAAYAANADLATVMGAAAHSTVSACYRVSEEQRKTLVIDLLETSAEKTAWLTQFENALFCVHLPKDGSSMDVETHVVDFVARYPHVRRVAVAGGVQLEHMSLLRRLEVEICIVGSAITQSPDPANAAEVFYRAAHDKEARA